MNNHLSAPNAMWPMFREGLRWETMPADQIGRRFDSPIMMIPENAKGRRRWLRRHKREDYRRVERDLAKSRGSRPRLGDWSIPATEGL